jgi:predicted phage gp36 major capsid-like protein
MASGRGDVFTPPGRDRATRAVGDACPERRGCSIPETWRRPRVILGVMTATGSDDFQALVHLVDRTVGSLGRLQAIVEDTLEQLEVLQGQLRTLQDRVPARERLNDLARDRSLEHHLGTDV